MDEQKIGIFGDSITWGAFDSEFCGWVNRLRSYFESGNYWVYIYNMGVSGNTSTDLLERFKSEATARGVNITIFAIGTNDSQYIKSTAGLKTPIDRFKSNIEELYAQAAAFSQKIVFIGLTDVDDTKTMPVSWDKTKFYSNEMIKQYNSLIQSFCEQKQLPFINLLGLLNSADLTEDGLHPNTSGHKKIFEVIKDFMVKNEIVVEGVEL